MLFLLIRLFKTRDLLKCLVQLRHCRPVCICQQVVVLKWAGFWWTASNIFKNNRFVDRYTYNIQATCNRVSADHDTVRRCCIMARHHSSASWSCVMMLPWNENLHNAWLTRNTKIANFDLKHCCIVHILLQTHQRTASKPGWCLMRWDTSLLCARLDLVIPEKHCFKHTQKT